jgi:RimJ/RimL family protein N-acetyltransferase
MRELNTLNSYGMTYILTPINKSIWKTLLDHLGIEKKWLFFIPKDAKVDFFTIDLTDNNNRTLIGSAYLIHYPDAIDCSFFVLPEFRRKGFARQFIIDLISKFEHIQFTVSKFNQPSMNLFSSMEILNDHSFNRVTNTHIFRPD